MSIQSDDLKILLISNSSQANIKYSDYETFDNFHETIKKIITNWELIMKGLYLNKECILYNENYNILKNKFGILMRNISKCKVTQILKAEKEKPLIDEVLLVYMITFHNITNNIDLLNVIIKFCILLREYLNSFGWDAFKTCEEYGVYTGYDTNQHFTNSMDCEYIPDLLNDFVSVFLELDPLFYIEKKILIRLCENFCNWLFANNLTSFKLYYNEE